MRPSHSRERSRNSAFKPSGEYTLPQDALVDSGFRVPAVGSVFTPAAFILATNLSPFTTLKPIWSILDPIVEPEGSPWWRKMSTPGNFMTSVPSTLIGVAPISVQNRFVASMSRAIVCQWLIVKTAPLGADAWPRGAATGDTAT